MVEKIRRPWLVERGSDKGGESRQPGFTVGVLEQKGKSGPDEKLV